MSSGNTAGLSIDEEESAETRFRRLISEHPVIIFSRSSCCMCHVMKKLLATIGVHPTVIELDDHEFASLPPPPAHDSQSSRNPAPAVFIGGTCIGGVESLVALHLSGHLVPKLVEVGVLWDYERVADKEDGTQIEGQRQGPKLSPIYQTVLEDLRHGFFSYYHVFGGL